MSDNPFNEQPPFNKYPPFGKHPGRGNETVARAEVQVKNDPIFKLVDGRLVPVKGKALRSIVPLVKLGAKSPVDTKPTTKKLSVTDDDEKENEHLEPQQLTKAAKTLIKVNEQKIIDHLREVLRRQKKKTKYAKLPVDLSVSGVFPEPLTEENNTLKQRMENCREWMRVMNELNRPKIEEQARVVANSLHIYWKERKDQEEE